jgi:hypothetical protein
MLAYPFKNMEWGDGIILLETNLLETKLFGSQFAMDEILETVIHSIVLRILDFSQFGLDNRYSYQFVSYISGAIFIAFIGWKLSSIEKKKSDFLAGLLFLGSSGFLLYFGYAENYSVLSLLFLIIIYLIRSWILEGRSSTYILIGATLLVTLGIYFHLVSGFLVVMLFYLWYEFSPKEEKWKHLLLCSLVGGVLLFLGFFYLLFLHDPTLDRKSSHLLHPPIYPWKRMISLNHSIEILSVIWYNSKLSVTIILYFLFFERADLKKFFGKRENKFVLFILLSFLLNGFIINPMLGFPADWDMIGFYWIPFAYLGYLLLLEFPNRKIYFVSLILFGFTLQLIQAKALSTIDPEKEKQVLLIQSIVDSYVKENKDHINELRKEDKKFFAKTDFFFYKSIRITDTMCPYPDREGLRQNLVNLRDEFKAGAENDKLNDKDWTKDFLKKATITNTEYIRSLEAHKLCHPEP